MYLNHLNHNWTDFSHILACGLELPHGPVQLDLMRHGETTANAANLITGTQDVPLTSVGEEQARKVGLKLDPHYELALHSTLERSRKTLLLALQAGNIKADRTCSDCRLNERSLGVLEMQPCIPLYEYARGDVHFVYPGAESYAEVARRCLNVLISLAVFAVETAAKKILVSCHQGTMRVLVGLIEEQSDPVHVMTRQFNNAELVRLKFTKVVLPRFMTVP